MHSPNVCVLVLEQLLMHHLKLQSTSINGGLHPHYASLLQIPFWLQWYACWGSMISMSTNTSEFGQFLRLQLMPLYPFLHVHLPNVQSPFPLQFCGQAFVESRYTFELRWSFLTGNKKGGYTDTLKHWSNVWYSYVVHRGVPMSAIVRSA